MLCPNCKNWEIADTDEYCGRCSYKVVRGASPAPRRSKALPLTLAAVAVLGAAGGVFYYLRYYPHTVKPIIQYFRGDHTSVTKGQQVTLQWAVRDALIVHIDQFPDMLPPQGERVVSPDKTTSYVLTAEGEHGIAVSRFEVKVPDGAPPPGPAVAGAPEIRFFKASQTTVRPGETVEFQFEVKDAERLSLDPGGILAPGATSARISPHKDTSYVLIAENGHGSVRSAPLNIRVEQPAPPAIEFSGDAQQIEVGGKVTLRWTCRNATSVRIDPGLGVQQAVGALTLTPGDTVAYTLTADGPGGRRTARFAIRVVPRIVDFDAQPMSLNGCDFAILRWKVDGATSISIDNGVGVVTSRPYVRVRPAQSTQYTLTAERLGGAATRQFRVAGFPPNGNCR